MKKSKAISLLLITAALASCSEKKPPVDPNQKKVYMRGDSTATYSRTHYHGGNGLLWWYAFRPYGMYDGTSYRHAGYYSGGISESSNVGKSSFKSNTVRGGFGGRGFSVSS